MQTSQELSNPTLKNLDSYEYAIIAVINFRTWMKYINKIKDEMEKKNPPYDAYSWVTRLKLILVS